MEAVRLYLMPLPGVDSLLVGLRDALQRSVNQLMQVLSSADSGYSTADRERFVTALAQCRSKVQACCVLHKASG